MKRIGFILLFVSLIALPGFANAQNQIQASSNNRNQVNSSSSNYDPQYDPENPDNPDSVIDNQPKGIVYDDKAIPDSVLRSHVFFFPFTTRTVKITKIQNPSLAPTGVQCNNPIDAIEQSFYASCGALGQVHKLITTEDSVQTNNPRLSAFTFSPDPIPYYRQHLHLSRFFQTQTPYTLLGYGSSLDKDYQIHIVHTQNIKPRWNIAMLYDLVSREGLYTNSGVTNHILDITTNYYSQDARYQMQAAIILNRIRHEENGGVTNDTTCWDYSRESGVPVHMYSAQNQWRDFELSIHQSFNTVRQFDLIREYEITDSVSISANSSDSTTDSTLKAKTKTVYDTTTAPKPSTFNTGVFALDLSYSRHRRIFTDNQATSWFYNLGTIDTTFCFDSTAHHQLAAELYWTNDAFMHHRYPNPIVITGGIRPQYDEVRFANPSNKTSELNITPFASARLHVGKFLLEAEAEETNGTYRLGDYRIDGKLSIDINNSHFTVSALSEAQSPAIVFYHNEGVYNWNINDYSKIKQQRISAEYYYLPVISDSCRQNSKFIIHNTRLLVSSTLLSDNVWFNSQMLPTQGNATALLLHADLSGHLQFGWLNLRTHQIFQYSSDDNVVRLPLFASKNSLFADFNLFRGAMRAQLGIDLRYHTKFYCDGWNPVLGAFYRQDDVKVGNYLIADVWLTLQVKRATIYLRAGHLNAPIEQLAGMQPSYFSLPHYPYENFTLYWGLFWKFFD